MKNYLEKDHEFDKVTMLGIFFYIAVFAGTFGFLYEYIFYFFNGGMKEFYWRGGNFLPWINIYATGSIMIYLLTYKLRRKPLKVFLISSLSTGILELVTGYVMDIVRHGNRCWDYNNEILNFGNIGGFVCLRSVLFFGISALFLMYVIVPLLFSLAKKLNKKTFLTIGTILFTIIMTDELYNLIVARVFHLPRAYNVYKSLGFKFVKFK